MTELPLSIGTMHLTGIGGIGMSGIAEILFELGYKIQGSDASDNANVRRLRDKGSLDRAQTILKALLLWSFQPRLNPVIRRWLQPAGNFCPSYTEPKCLEN